MTDPRFVVAQLAAVVGSQREPARLVERPVQPQRPLRSTTVAVVGVSPRMVAKSKATPPLADRALTAI